MKLFKYNTVLLMMMFGGLVAAGMAYATTSVPTSGPSVGHRPVVTGLVLGAVDSGGLDKGDIALSSTLLKPGDGIGLANAAGGPNGMDVDGDLDKGGAHCVWYRVDSNGASTVVKDPGPTDRNCTYTIQVSDAGFKIKNVITIFSDQDIATQKGYTLNPIESIPVETVSANSVTQIKQPLTIEVNGQNVSTDIGFPTTGFSQATFTLVGMPIVGTTWTSSHANVTVAPDGQVTFNNEVNGPVTIKGESTTGLKAEYSFTLNRWYTGFGQMKLNYADAEAYCQNRGERIPLLNLVIGRLPSFTSMTVEWGDISYYKGSGIIATRATGSVFDREGQWGVDSHNMNNRKGIMHLQGQYYTDVDSSILQQQLSTPRYVMCEKIF